MLLVYMPYSSPRMSLGGWWGKRSSLGKSYSCQGTSATFSPLQLCGRCFFFLGCASQGCAYEPMPSGIWPSEHQEYGFCTWNLPIWHSLVLSVLHLLPVALGISAHCCNMPSASSLPALQVKCAQWFCRERNWSDAYAAVAFTHTRVLDFCHTLSETYRIPDAQCFFPPLF